MKKIHFYTIAFVSIEFLCSFDAYSQARFRKLSIETVEGKQLRNSNGAIFNYCPNNILHFINNKGKYRKKKWEIGKSLSGENYIIETDDDGDTSKIYFLQIGNDFYTIRSGYDRKNLVTHFGVANCRY